MNRHCKISAHHNTNGYQVEFWEDDANWGIGLFPTLHEAVKPIADWVYFGKLHAKHSKNNPVT